MSSYPMDLRIQLVREPQPAGPRPVVDSPARLAAILLPYVAAEHDDGREVFGLAVLTVRHRLTGLHVVSVGAMTASLVHPREVFGPALVAKAAALALWHTHPSCDPEPSAEDISLTRRLAAGGALLGIEVVDHLVLAADGSGHVSMKERGML